MSQFSRQSEDMTFQSVSCCLDPALLHPEHLPDKKWHLQKLVKFKIRVWLPEVSLVFYRVESCHSSELRRVITSGFTVSSSQRESHSESTAATVWKSSSRRHHTHWCLVKYVLNGTAVLEGRPGLDRLYCQPVCDRWRSDVESICLIISSASWRSGGVS